MVVQRAENVGCSSCIFEACDVVISRVRRSFALLTNKGQGIKPTALQGLEDSTKQPHEHGIGTKRFRMCCTKGLGVQVYLGCSGSRGEVG